MTRRPNQAAPGNSRRASFTCARVPYSAPEPFHAPIFDFRRKLRITSLASGWEDGEPLGADLAEQLDRIRVAGRPEFRVDRLQQIARVRMPRPAQIGHDRAEPHQFGRKRGSYREPSQCLHGEHTSGCR